MDQERRKYHVNNALASFELEGEHPSEELKILLEQYVSGEIETIKELEDKFNSGADVCTLMQKDVLIELVASAIAAAIKRKKYKGNFITEQQRLKEIRFFIYQTNKNDISFTNLANEIKELSARIEKYPIS